MLANYKVRVRVAVLLPRPTRQPTRRPTRRPTRKPTLATRKVLPPQQQPKAAPTANRRKLPASRIITTYPYRKFLVFDRVHKQWNYKPLKLKAGCTLTFKWSIPPNKRSLHVQTRGLAFSRISGAACLQILDICNLLIVAPCSPEQWQYTYGLASSSALLPPVHVCRIWMAVCFVLIAHYSQEHRDPLLSRNPWSMPAVCNTTPSRYKVLTRAKPYSQFSIRLPKRGVYFFWDTRGRDKNTPRPSQTSYPYDQYWIGCQFGSYIHVTAV